MSKLKLLIPTIMIAVTITGCSSKSGTDKLIIQAEKALNDGNYVKVESLMEMALERDPDNKRAQKLYDTGKNYNLKYKELKEIDTENTEDTIPADEAISNASMLIADGDYEKASSELEKVNKQDLTKSQEDTIEKLTNKIAERIDDSSDVQDDIEEVTVKEERSKHAEESRVKKKDVVEQENQTEYEESIEISGNSNEALAYEYIDKANRLISNLETKYRSAEDSAIEDSTRAEYSHKRYEEWDGLLNEIWRDLKTTLPKEKMDRLLIEQRQWIKDKESAAKQQASQYQDESVQRLAKEESLLDSTINRFYYLKDHLLVDELIDR